MAKVKNTIRTNSKQKTESSSKKKNVNYKRLNELYLDYKNRNIKINKLAKENDIKDGISFKPYFIDDNQQMKKYKDQIGNIPYLSRLNIYSEKGFSRKRLNTTEKVTKSKKKSNKSINFTTSKRKYK